MLENKKSRFLDSEDEELSLGNDYDQWLKSKKEFAKIIHELMGTDVSMLGLGIPERSHSYILGRPRDLAVGKEKDFS